MGASTALVFKICYRIYYICVVCKYHLGEGGTSEKVKGELTCKPPSQHHDVNWHSEHRLSQPSNSSVPSAAALELEVLLETPSTTYWGFAGGNILDFITIEWLSASSRPDADIAPRSLIIAAL